MADGASSAPAPAPAPVAARGRPTAAPGPIELSDEKTVQTLATPDSFGAPLARLSPSPTGHGYGSTPPSTSTARRGAKPCIFSAPAGRRETRPRAACGAGRAAGFRFAAARRADAARRRVARESPGHGAAGRAARDAAELPALRLRGLGDRRLVAEPRRRRLHRLAALTPLQLQTTSLPRLMPPAGQKFDGSARTPRSAQVYGINTGRTLRSLIPPYRLT